MKTNTKTVKGRVATTLLSKIVKVEPFYDTAEVVAVYKNKNGLMLTLKTKEGRLYERECKKCTLV